MNKNGKGKRELASIADNQGNTTVAQCIRAGLRAIIQRLHPCFMQRPFH
jgi:hypothetical protein